MGGGASSLFAWEGFFAIGGGGRLFPAAGGGGGFFAARSGTDGGPLGGGPDGGAPDGGPPTPAFAPIDREDPPLATPAAAATDPELSVELARLDRGDLFGLGGTPPGAVAEIDLEKSGLPSDLMLSPVPARSRLAFFCIAAAAPFASAAAIAFAGDDTGFGAAGRSGVALGDSAVLLIIAPFPATTKYGFSSCPPVAVPAPARFSTVM
jgi:hypothetical protein